MKIEQAAYLSRVYHSICRAWGASEHQAEVFARVILEGDLVGRPEQGMKIVQIDHLMGTHNQVNFTDEPTVEKQGVCHAVINGHKGLGQYILTRAMEKAIALAKENTIGMVWVYNWLDIRLRQRLRATRPGTWWVWPSPTPCP
jgi:LDH2 family malate/lactate/ureidoglycolate dehydrogenase